MKPGWSRLIAASFEHGMEDYSPDVEIQTHTNGIRGNQNIDSPLIEESSLCRSCLGRKLAIDNSTFKGSESLDFFFNGEDFKLAEGNYTVSRQTLRIVAQKR